MAEKKADKKELIITLGAPLLPWLERIAKKRGVKVQQVIYDKLHNAREAEASASASNKGG